MSGATTFEVEVILFSSLSAASQRRQVVPQMQHNFLIWGSEEWSDETSLCPGIGDLNFWQSGRMFYATVLWLLCCDEAACAAVQTSLEWRTKKEVISKAQRLNVLRLRLEAFQELRPPVEPEFWFWACIGRHVHICLCTTSWKAARKYAKDSTQEIRTETWFHLLWLKIEFAVPESHKGHNARACMHSHHSGLDTSVQTSVKMMVKILVASQCSTNHAYLHFACRANQQLQQDRGKVRVLQQRNCFDSLIILDRRRCDQKGCSWTEHLLEQRVFCRRRWVQHEREK